MRRWLLTLTHVHSLDRVVQTKNVFVQNKNDLPPHLGYNLLESHPANIRYQAFQRPMGVQDHAGPPGSYFIFSPVCKNVYATTRPPCVFPSFSITFLTHFQPWCCFSCSMNWKNWSLKWKKGGGTYYVFLIERWDGWCVQHSPLKATCSAAPFFFFLPCGYGGMSGSGSVETVSHYTLHSLVLGIIGGRCQCKLRRMEGRVGADGFCEGRGGQG